MTKNSEIQQAHIQWNENNSPQSVHFNDIYFSKLDGIAESNYVFIEANNLKERWNQLTPNAIFTIGETGFGTGLNFFATWFAWNQFRKLHPTSSNLNKLHFISVEKYPLDIEDITRALSVFPDITYLVNQFKNHYPPQPLCGVHRLSFQNNEIQLTLCFDEAKQGLDSLLCSDSSTANFETKALSFGGPEVYVDAWYFDGFAPQRNPEMWRKSLFESVARLSKPNVTSFATFTAASRVRNTLDEVGFKCKKIKGFANKREQLTGIFTQNALNAIEKQLKPSWHIRRLEDGSIPTDKNVTVIGGGLAGCHTANSLAKNNFNVKIIEANKEVAMAASGNLQGVVYTKLSLDKNPLCQFNLASQLYANQFYYNHNFFNTCGKQSGVFHIACTPNDKKNYSSIVNQFQGKNNFLKWIDEADTEEVIGLPLNFSGLLMHKAGWLSPKTLCKQLIDHKNIDLITNTHVQYINRDGNSWELYDNHNRLINKSSILVIANASSAKSFSQTSYLPIKSIRGQVTHVPETSLSKQLRTTVCGAGYIAPATNEGQHCIGATFTLKDHSEFATQQEHLENIQNIDRVIPGINIENTVDLSALTGRVAFRSTSPDYLPIVGPIPHLEKMYQDFLPLSKNANRIIPKPGSYLPNLYCNLAHGSKGLAYTPLAAEILTSIICGQPLPITKSLFLHLHPARFAIRNLVRNKVSL